MNGETTIQRGLITELIVPLYSCKGWMKLVGAMSIVSGAIAVLTIIGIVFAWLPIWTGVLLFQSANAVGQAYETDSKEALVRSLSKLKIYFIIMGILTLVGVLFWGLAFFGFLGAGLFAPKSVHI
jgi:hypothetical protein